MDLHLRHAAPTPEERAAVDALLGPPRSAWDGGERGSIVAPVYIDRGLRRGVVFMTLHFPDDVATNLLTINATDPKSGTAEFKACAVRVEPVRTVPSYAARHRETLAATGDD